MEDVVFAFKMDNGSFVDLVGSIAQEGRYSLHEDEMGEFIDIEKDPVVQVEAEGNVVLNQAELKRAIRKVKGFYWDYIDDIEDFWENE